MLFVLIGIIVIALNLFHIGPIGLWDWDFFGDLWKFTVPFWFAVAWWIWSDKTGLNKRREMDRMDKKKANRRKENLAALGMDRESRKARKARQQR